MRSDFRIQIAGKTYTRANLHEVADDPNIDLGTDECTCNSTVHNEVNSDSVVIQAHTITGGITFGE